MSAYFIMVAVDDKGRPTEVPPLILSSDKESELFEQGKRRYEMCRKDLISDDGDFRACREEPISFD